MSSPASIKGHPLHPVLVAFPIGLWIFSIISDLIFKLGYGGPIWNDVAFYTLAGGIVGALVAALPGLIDLVSIENSKSKSIGIWHMVINLRSEEHTSELQSRFDLVCRLLLEKKKK